MSRTVGNRIKMIRGNKITQEQFSRKINIPFRTYRRYEAGESTIPADVVLRIAKLFHVSIDWILTGKESLSGATNEKLKDSGVEFLERRKEVGRVIKSALLKIYKPVCAHCGFGIQSILEVGYLVPPFKVGKPELDNMIILCPNCHRMFHERLISEESLRDSRERVKLTKRQLKQPAL